MGRLFYMFTCSLVCILLVCFILGFISHCAPFGVKGEAQIGIPQYFERSSVRWGGITDFAVCNKTLYVLYEGKKVLDCYSLDGIYLHSYYIELGEKGKSALYVSGGKLYLKSKGSTFYVFCDGIFSQSYQVPAKNLHSEIEALRDEKNIVDEYKYELRRASILRNKDGVCNVIVYRPEWMIAFQGNAVMLIGTACFIGLWAILCYNKKLSTL